MPNSTNNNPSDLPDWANWIARDENGKWWAYEVEPLRHDSGWYENEVGRNLQIPSWPDNIAWQESLQKVKDKI